MKKPSTKTIKNSAEDVGIAGSLVSGITAAAPRKLLEGFVFDSSSFLNSSSETSSKVKLSKSDEMDGSNDSTKRKRSQSIMDGFQFEVASDSNKRQRRNSTDSSADMPDVSQALHEPTSMRRLKSMKKISMTDDNILSRSKTRLPSLRKMTSSDDSETITCSRRNSESSSLTFDDLPKSRRCRSVSIDLSLVKYEELVREEAKRISIPKPMLSHPASSTDMSANIINVSTNISEPKPANNDNIMQNFRVNSKKLPRGALRVRDPASEKSSRENNSKSAKMNVCDDDEIVDKENVSQNILSPSKAKSKHDLSKPVVVVSEICSENVNNMTGGHVAYGTVSVNKDKLYNYRKPGKRRESLK